MNQIRVGAAREENARCTFCREVVGADAQPCDSCGVRMHATCRGELGRCTTLGCTTETVAHAATVDPAALERLLGRPALSRRARRQLFYRDAILGTVVAGIVALVVMTLAALSMLSDGTPEGVVALIVVPLAALFVFVVAVGGTEGSDSTAWTEPDRRAGLLADVKTPEAMRLVNDLGIIELRRIAPRDEPDTPLDRYAHHDFRAPAWTRVPGQLLVRVWRTPEFLVVEGERGESFLLEPAWRLEE